jgi:hypothetical protein
VKTRADNKNLIVQRAADLFIMNGIKNKDCPKVININSSGATRQLSKHTRKEHTPI